MTLITEDYFKGGKNLFPGGTSGSPHLAQLIIELQKITSVIGFHEQVLAVGAESEYTTLANALAAITDSSASKPYVVLVNPNEYTEDLVLKPYVFVIGKGSDATRLNGRVVGPSSGSAAITGMSITANVATPAVDLATGDLKLFDCRVKNLGAGQSIRVTGGALNFYGGSSEDGPIQVTGGELNLYNSKLSGFSGSDVSNGICRLFDILLDEAIVGQPFSVTNLGDLVISYARMKNASGGMFYLNGAGAKLRYNCLLNAGLASGGYAIKADVGAIEAGLRNFGLGTFASGWVKVIDNAFDSGDIFILNGVSFEAGVDFVVGINATASALALKNAINASTDPLIAGKVTASINGGDATQIDFDADSPGSDGNTITLAETDNATDNFTRSGSTLTVGSGNTFIDVGVTVTNLVLGL